MKTISAIKDRFPVSIRNEPEPLAELAIESRTEHHPTYHQNLCPTCSDSEWWEPYGDQPRSCVHCEPWPEPRAASVRRNYFFDFDGNEWEVKEVANGGELTIRVIG
jgi:hypothetical protein